MNCKPGDLAYIVRECPVCWFTCELMASFLTLAGIYIGSTTASGASFYLASLVFWYALTWGRRLWGLMPLNVASTVVAGINLWRALA